MPASTNTKARREREASFPSCPYTQTVVRLYPNGLAPIPNLKRTLKQALAQTASRHSGDHRPVLSHRRRQVRSLCDRLGLWLKKAQRKPPLCAVTILWTFADATYDIIIVNAMLCLLDAGFQGAETISNSYREAAGSIPRLLDITIIAIHSFCLWRPILIKWRISSYPHC